MRRRRSRRRAIGTWAPLVTDAMANARWSVDFVPGQFADRRRFRTVNVIDYVTKESLAAVVETSISGRRVAQELTALMERHGKPGVIAPGKPMQNGNCEASNGQSGLNFTITTEKEPQTTCLANTSEMEAPRATRGPLSFVDWSSPRTYRPTMESGAVSGAAIRISSTSA